jgi:hypothetical protein
MQGIIVDLLSYSHWHIDVHVQGGLYEQRWHGTFVYGELKASEHHQMWTLLRRIRPLSSEPWMMTGDFNEAMWQGEHFSHTRRSERLMRDFREVLSDCDLHDLGFARTPWTFDNHQQGEKMLEIIVMQKHGCRATCSRRFVSTISSRHDRTTHPSCW